MNILVIGNGFDLAHGLPTTYQDFLRFTDDYEHYLHPAIYASDLVWSIIKQVYNNTWLRHFKKIYDLNGWIEFESEISNVVQIMEKKITQFEVTKEEGKGYVMFNSEEEIVKDFDSSIVPGRVYNIKVVKDNKDRMLEDLNNLIKCLEMYLAYYVNRMKVRLFSPDIKDLDIQKVLSFNYTDTYERIYDTHKNNGIEYEYIHGKADPDNDIDTNNMVLGIDEYLPDDRKNKDVEFIAFKKYYQRIYKGTGSRYKDWINTIREENEKYMERKQDCDIFLKNGYGLSNEIEARKKELEQLNENPPRHNLYIFGHSLDITDGDVMRDLILNENVYTTIFYPDKEELGRKIANLVKVIGQDELIRRTGGSTKTIEFKLQRDMYAPVIAHARITSPKTLNENHNPRLCRGE